MSCDAYSSYRYIPTAFRQMDPIASPEFNVAICKCCWNMRVGVKLAHVAVQVAYTQMDAHSRVRLRIGR